MPDSSSKMFKFPGSGLGSSYVKNLEGEKCILDQKYKIDLLNQNMNFAMVESVVNNSPYIPSFFSLNVMHLVNQNFQQV